MDNAVWDWITYSWGWSREFVAFVTGSLLGDAIVLWKAGSLIRRKVSAWLERRQTAAELAEQAKERDLFARFKRDLHFDAATGGKRLDTGKLAEVDQPIYKCRVCGAESDDLKALARTHEKPSVRGDRSPPIMCHCQLFDQVA